MVILAPVGDLEGIETLVNSQPSSVHAQFILVVSGNADSESEAVQALCQKTNVHLIDMSQED